METDNCGDDDGREKKEIHREEEIPF